MACIPRRNTYFILLKNCNGLKFLQFSRVLQNGRNNLKSLTASYCNAAAAQSDSNDSSDTSPKQISKAMESYLKRTREYEQFLKEQTEEYNKGKKFLAKIMDKDPKNFDQKEIDKAIEYLFPSALFDLKARPCFKPPEILFPKQKEAQFDDSGRPFHFLFYTSKPNFYQILHECAQHFDKLNQKLSKLGPDVIPPKKQLALTGTVWLKKEDLEEKILETIINVEYETFIESMDRLLEHPYSFEAADFILKYRTSEMSKRLVTAVLPKIQELENGRSLVAVERVRKKHCYADVKLLSPGTGKILINGKELIDIFPDIRTRGQVLYPLLLTDMLGKVDIEATVDDSGHSAQAVAVRTGVAQCVLPFVSKEVALEMKLSGLLQADPRVRERKKSGQKGARAKYTWLKR